MKKRIDEEEGTGEERRRTKFKRKGEMTVYKKEDINLRGW